MRIQETGVILLAGGTSARFGVADKLRTSLNGMPLAWHSASVLATMPFARRIAVAPVDLPVDWAAIGFERVDAPSEPMMSASIAAGIAPMLVSDCAACLIALADMPFVPQHHFEALIQADDGPVVASGLNGKTMAPALFHRVMWKQLANLSGDMGARQLIQNAPTIAAQPEWMRDIDTPEDLANAM